MSYTTLTTAVGTLYIVEADQRIVAITTDQSIIATQCSQLVTPVLQQACLQLEEYFAGQRRQFTLPLAPQGTPFQLKVWHALQQIPYGTTCSYGDIAKRIDNPKGSRAVGMANNRNQLMIVIPCHRVIGANGKMVGYSAGLSMKEYLLNLERSHTQ